MVSVTVGLVALICIVAYFYNRFVFARNRCLAAWADVNVQLVRRHELIPNLVRAVEGYADFETRTLKLITLARSYQANNSVVAINELEQKLSHEFSALYALIEDYPELKASKSYLELSSELVQTEDLIQHARRYYNGTVRVYNTRLQQFPSLLIAKIFRFSEKKYFSLARPEHSLPTGVKLN